ncbi:MAG: hypothetical protein K2O91_19675 [Lachnospiraceae bacterium]|nr:hypothetical protein [Lachnospiraceae bacterium]
MYHVIVVLDEKRNKSYYYSYVDKDGNIECEELPPYQDINKARACYWDGKKWNYDADKHEEIVAVQEAEKAAAEQAAQEAEAVPTLREIGIALMEIAENVNTNMGAITELAAIVSKMISEKGGES